MAKGEYVYKRGQSGDTMYFIIKGKAAVTLDEHHLSRKPSNILGAIIPNVMASKTFNCELSQGGRSARSRASKRSKTSRRGRLAKDELTPKGSLRSLNAESATQSVERIKPLNPIQARIKEKI